MEAEKMQEQQEQQELAVKMNFASTKKMIIKMSL
jgi:hypothetical protein